MTRAGRNRREAFKSAALAALVAAALGLNALLWLETPGGAPPPSRPYVAPGNGAAPPPAALVSPWRILVHRAGRHALLSDPADGTFAVLVAATARAAASSLAGGALPEPLPSAAAWAAARRSGSGWEFDLPLELPLSDWVGLWSGAPSAGARSPAREPGPAAALPVRRLGVFLADGGAATVYFEGSRGVFRAAAPGGPALEEPLGRAAQAGAPATALAGTWRRLAAAEDLYVPAEPRFRMAVATGEALAGVPFRASFFPDPGVVRLVPGRDGSGRFTDGRVSLSVRAEGAVRFDGTAADGTAADGTAGGVTAPGAPRGVRPATALGALGEATAFVAAHGGWPGGTAPTQLFDGRDAGGDGWRFRFATRVAGAPFLGTFASEGDAAPTPPLAAEVAAGGAVTGFSRFLWLSPRLSTPVPAPLGPGEALALLDRELARPGGTRAVARVTAVYPAYIAVAPAPSGAGADAGPAAPLGPAAWERQPADTLLRPVWAVETEGGLEAVVEVLTGRVRRLPPPAEGGA